MLPSEAEWVFMGLVLFISGVQGRANAVCAFSGSAVNLTCSTKDPSSSMKWFAVNKTDRGLVLNELTADENEEKYSMTEESTLTLTINDVRESDEKFYCCRKNTDNSSHCWRDRTELQVAELQVKVIPSTEGQTVTLMCSTSCPLTENPAAYIWYKNGALLYEDWSPWYQELLSSDPAVRYSCAVKGNEDLRAPEVSVDSVTPTCFSVTYSRRRMCPNNQTSRNKACSITYPRKLQVLRGQRSSTVLVELNCNTSCPEVDPKISYRWYEDRTVKKLYDKPQYDVSSSSTKSFYCAIKDHEDLLSPDVCAVENKCRTMNYVRRRICALQGSSVEIISRYSESDIWQTTFRSWYKIKGGEQEDAVQLIDTGRVQYHDNTNEHILKIENLNKSDSGEYVFTTQRTSDRGGKLSDFPKVRLVVTGLSVWIHSAEVTEGQRVTLTCSTSCPLTDNTNYTWTFNSKPMDQNKHLVLDPVRIQDAGKYSCSVRNGRRNIISSEKTLTVQSIVHIEDQRSAGTFVSVATGIRAALVVLIFLIVILCIGKEKIFCQTPGNETSNNVEQRPQQQEPEQILLSVISSESNNTTEHVDETVDI